MHGTINHVGFGEFISNRLIQNKLQSLVRAYIITFEHCFFTQKREPFLSIDLFVWDVISNHPIRTGLDFKSSHFDPVLGFASDLKSRKDVHGLEI